MPNSKKQTQRNSKNEETNLVQVKEQHRNPEKELNEMETSNVPDKEFKT